MSEAQRWQEPAYPMHAARDGDANSRISRLDLSPSNYIQFNHWADGCKIISIYSVSHSPLVKKKAAKLHGSLPTVPLTSNIKDSHVHADSWTPNNNISLYVLLFNISCFPGPGLTSLTKSNKLATAMVMLWSIGYTASNLWQTYLWDWWLLVRWQQVWIRIRDGDGVTGPQSWLLNDSLSSCCQTSPVLQWWWERYCHWFATGFVTGRWKGADQIQCRPLPRWKGRRKNSMFPLWQGVSQSEV